MTTRRPVSASVFASALAFALGAATASAQTLSPTLEPGLWETDPAVLINGKDVMGGVRQMQDQVMRSLPPEQRQQMAAMMARQGVQMAGSKIQQCLTLADTERATKPSEAIAEMRRQAQHCRFDNPVVSGSKLSFQGRCEDPNGFTGDIRGEFVVDGPKAWHGQFGGQGKVSQVENIPGVQSTPDGNVLMQMTSRSRWLSADCGSVKPAVRGR